MPDLAPGHVLFLSFPLNVRSRVPQPFPTAARASIWPALQDVSNMNTSQRYLSFDDRHRTNVMDGNYVSAGVSMLRLPRPVL